MAHLKASAMPYNGEPIRYKYKRFELFDGVEILYITPAEDDMALIEHERHLWKVLMDKVMAKHGAGKSIPILRADTHIYAPHPNPLLEPFLKFKQEREAQGGSDYSSDVVENLY